MADCESPEVKALYRERRASQPVFFDERAQSWFIYRYDDVKAVLTDWQTFSSDYQTHLPSSPLGKTFTGMLLGFDPPRHVKLRNLVARAFTARSVEELGPRISASVRQLIDGFKGQGRCELVEDFADIVPVLALADLLGVPGELHVYFRDLARAYGAMLDMIFSGKPVDPRPQEELDGYFTKLLEERRKSPREDLISRLLSAEVDGERLTQEELLGFCKILLLGGIGTTARLIVLALLTFLEHPDDLARLRMDMQLLPSAIEEVLRLKPPVNGWPRVTTKDVELRGQRIPAKQQIFVMASSANRDETCFADPDRFDMTRSPNPHLTFGSGVHFCLGPSLARIEAKIALTALLENLKDIELANEEPLVHLPGFQNGLVSLPIRFQAKGNG